MVLCVALGQALGQACGKAMALAMAVAMAMAMTMATAMAVAVIKPQHAIGADLHENWFFIEKHVFSVILVISEPSRPQRWIWLKIRRWKMVSEGLET